jgi:hypothetical protein
MAEQHRLGTGGMLIHVEDQIESIVVVTMHNYQSSKDEMVELKEP